MKLYEIPKGSKIRLDLMEGDEDSPETSKQMPNQICTFHGIDCRYSTIETPDGALVHLSASAPLILGEDGIYSLENDA